MALIWRHAVRSYFSTLLFGDCPATGPVLGPHARGVFERLDTGSDSGDRRSETQAAMARGYRAKNAALDGRRPARVAALRSGGRRLRAGRGLPLCAQGGRREVQQRCWHTTLAVGRVVDPGADRSHRGILVRRQPGRGRVATVQSHEGDEGEPDQAGGRMESLRDPRTGGQNHAFGERRGGPRDWGHPLTQGLWRAGGGRGRERVSEYQGDGGGVGEGGPKATKTGGPF